MKRYVAMFLCIVMCICTAAVPMSAADIRDLSIEEGYAVALKQLGLFKGVSGTDFDLGRAPTRIEALVMLIRVLGKEQDALGGTWQHPFDDVPTWANAYVGYAYANGLTNGISDTKFGSSDATAATYLTFVLRALGYSDTNGADFTWDNPFALAKTVGILPDRVNVNNFWRADVATVSYFALSAKMKDSADTLADKLIDAGAFTMEQYGAAMNSKPSEDTPTVPTTPSEQPRLTAVEISEKCAPAVFYIEVYSYSGVLMRSGSGFFISANGYAITNFHVGANSNYMIITTSDGTKYDNIRIVDASKKDDLMLLKVTTDDTFTYLEPSDYNTVKQGQSVYAIGSPLGLENTLSQGIVSNPQRIIDETTYIQISVPIDSGSSGGALIDEYGKVIAVTTASYTDNTADLNLAVPIVFANELDKSNLNDVQAWSDDYYIGFDGVYDFGVFAGMLASESEWLPLECSATYSISGVKPIDPIDPALPNLSVDEVFAECVAQYKNALSAAGFTHINTENGWLVYEKGDTTVKLLETTEGEKKISILTTREAEYYEDFPTVPDAAWYIGLDKVEPVENGEEYSYIYSWSEKYENISYFAVDFAFYYLLLLDEGFELNAQTISEDGMSISYSFIGNGCSIDCIICENDFTVTIIPISALPVSEAFATLRDYLIENGEYYESENSYRLLSYEGDDRYDVTYYENTGTLCFGMLTETDTELKDSYIFIEHDGSTMIHYEYETEADSETGGIAYYANIIPTEFSSATKLETTYYNSSYYDMQTYHDLTVERGLDAIRYCDMYILPDTDVSAADLGFTQINN